MENVDSVIKEQKYKLIRNFSIIFLAFVLVAVFGTPLIINCSDVKEDVKDICQQVVLQAQIGLPLLAVALGVMRYVFTMKEANNLISNYKKQNGKCARCGQLLDIIHDEVITNHREIICGTHTDLIGKE